MPGRSTPLLADARHLQIAALSALLAVNFLFVDFGARPLASALAIAASLATQMACAWWFGLRELDLRSPLITGLSLSLLLRADEPSLHAAAGALAILSKFVIRRGDKHVFNPAGFAIVALLVLSDHVWISPGQWGTSVWFAALVAFAAILVLRAARRADIAVFFLASHAGLLLARAWWLGDPLAIPLHQLQSGSLLIFAFFMISDPRTAPDARLGRCIFAFAVALAAYWLAFSMQMRPALYVALIALSPFTLLIDRILPARRFAWTAPVERFPSRSTRNKGFGLSHFLRKTGAHFS
ncbi:MAG TPA: RnfABCDGE type electron transport complex subunit D [Xanthobacteraceae bacterium]|nr:RnfABCDGE type electron transport complex subunit D [Xanthobacteraceae bacterium]